MKNLKKLTLLGTLAFFFTVAACNAVNSDESNLSSSSSSSALLSEFSRIDGSATSETVSSDESSTDDVSSDENSSEESRSDNGESSDENNDSESSFGDSSSEGEEENEYEAIMDEAESLDYGESMDGYYELSGTITSVETEYSASKGVCLYFDVDEPQNRSIYCYQLKGDGADIVDVGDWIRVSGSIKNYYGIIEFDKNSILLEYEISPENILPDSASDPYKYVSESEFYMNYTVATDANDAYYRSLHGFMSGTLETPDQAPNLSSYQPKSNGKFVRNSEMQLSEDGKTYTVVDAYGQEAFRVYKGGAYVTLEEVAAYVYAFGTYPANYTTSKDTKPSKSVWGKYLRLNHTAFSGDTSSYPYEPILPNISGCGGSLHYYEMDIGTTGTDCDPSYPSKIYNDGSTITRGAARIVYGKEDLNHNGVYEIGEFHVFYTYNHYNDFQEYLNYEGGWGEKFGNITGGGTISSRYDYNPTDYVDVVLAPLTNDSARSVLRIDYYCDDRRYAAA